MKTSTDCIQCFLRQALEGADVLDVDAPTRNQLVRSVLKLLAEADFDVSPPVIAKRVYNTLRWLTENHDPCQMVKKRSNELAWKLYPRFWNRVRTAADPREMALRLAIAANVMDFGVNPRITEGEVLQALEGAVQEPLTGPVDQLFEAIDSATRILYLTDNAGEIVFDRMLIEQLPVARITLAVRGGPILNDALMEDAKQAGLIERVRTIANGSHIPGTLLEDCSAEFRKCFDEADLVIAKGQGNYETLSGIFKNIFYLLRPKCPVVARHLARPLGGLVIHSELPSRRRSSATIAKSSVTPASSDLSWVSQRKHAQPKEVHVI